jgi:hypothetical protein
VCSWDIFFVSSALCDEWHLGGQGDPLRCVVHGDLVKRAAGQFLLVLMMQKPSPSALSPTPTAYSRNNLYLNSRQISKVYYNEFLANYLQNHATRPNPRSPGFPKLARLTPPQFFELSTDVYDELVRRRNANEGIFLHLTPFIELLLS